MFLFSCGSKTEKPTEEEPPVENPVLPDGVTTIKIGELGSEKPYKTLSDTAAFSFVFSEKSKAYKNDNLNFLFGLSDGKTTMIWTWYYENELVTITPYQIDKKLNIAKKWNGETRVIKLGQKIYLKIVNTGKVWELQYNGKSSLKCNKSESKDLDLVWVSLGSEQKTDIIVNWEKQK